MSDTRWLPIQAVEGLLWRRGCLLVDKSKQLHRMNDDCNFPSIFSFDNIDTGTYELDKHPGTEYYVDDPLVAFAELANAGKSYGLRAYKPQYNRDAVLIAKTGRSNNRLLKFIRDHGLPVDELSSSPVRMGYVHHALSGLGHSDIGHGNVGDDLRTTAAIAYLCWTLWETLRVLEGADKQAKLGAIKTLKSHLHAIDADTLDLSFYESENVGIPESDFNIWTFLPGLETKDAACHWATFFSSSATSEEVTLQQGVYTTISKVALWYLQNQVNIMLAPLNGDASPPQMMIRLGGLRSYLWMHFLHTIVGRGVPKFYLVQCRQDEGANGCGRWFYSEGAKAGRCNECQTIVNRVEQRIKRNPNLKRRKHELIEEERLKTIPYRSV